LKPFQAYMHVVNHNFTLTRAHLLPQRLHSLCTRAFERASS